MILPQPLDGVTLQLGVTDMKRSRAFHGALYGQTPAFLASEDFQEHEPHPGFWLQITTQAAPQQLSRLRFGVPDIAATITTLRSYGVAIADRGTVPGVVAWANFTDPDGNPLGAYQDLAKHPPTNG